MNLTEQDSRDRHILAPMNKDFMCSLAIVHGITDASRISLRINNGGVSCTLTAEEVIAGIVKVVLSSLKI